MLRTNRQPLEQTQPSEAAADSAIPDEGAPIGHQVTLLSADSVESARPLDSGAMEAVESVPDPGSNRVVASTRRPASSSYPRVRFLPILPLSSGGMAHVELAVGIEAGNFKKLMVLKTIREELAFDPDIVAMFLNEARLCARLNHANLVQVYEVMENPRPCIVMEYLEGLSLTEIQRALGDGFEPLVQLRILSDVLAGLHYAHELSDYDGTALGMVHRDVSPQNIVVTSDGRVKVLDFGIAKVANSPSYTQAGMVKGKMSYMSPEQLAGEPLDRRTDVFAVGCMLWRAAAGRKLWAKSSTEDIMRALVNGHIPSPSMVREVDPQLEAIVMRATAPNRKHRYESAAALRADLDEYLSAIAPDGCDLRDWMELTFAEHWAQQRETIRARLVDATSMPPLPVSSVAPVELDRVTIVPTTTVPVSRKSRLIAIGIVAAAVGVLLLGAMSLIGFLEDSATARAEAVTHPASLAGQLVPLRIKAEPRGAQISVDGALVTGNPAMVDVAAGHEHLVEVAQQGYSTLMRRLRVERETSVEFSLVPESVVRESNNLAMPAPARKANPVASVHPNVSVSGPPTSSESVPTASSESVSGSTEREDPCAVPFYFKDGIKSYKPECL